MDEPQAPPDRTSDGVVLELLPSHLVRVELDGRHQVTAHLASPVGRNFVRVIVGDPGRSYFPRDGLVRLAEYQVPTTRELEDMEVKRTGVWSFAA